MEEDGTYTAKFGSPDQGAMGLPVEKTEFSNGNLKLDLSNFGIKYEANVTDDPLTMQGSFIQGDTLELNLVRFNQMPDLTLVKKEIERPQRPHGPYPYDEEEVVYENTDASVSLAGTLSLPRTDNPSAAVILIHGSGRNDRNGTHFGTFHLLADYLTRQGIAVLRYDKRGAGESSGNYGQSTTHDFAEDVKAGITFLKNHGRIDSEMIGLIGHSEGGLIAPMVAATSEDISFIVIMAGLGQTFGEAASFMRTDNAIINGASEHEAKILRSWYSRFYEIAAQESDTLIRKNRVRDAYHKLPEDEKGIINWSDESIAREVKGTQWIWFREAFKLDPIEYIRNVACPVLAVTGEKDRQVNPKENLPLIEKALKEGKNNDYMVKELPGLNHLFQTAETGMVSEYDKIAEIIAPYALKMIGEWILERTGD